MQSTTVVSIGNFDGVHRGHQALFAQARSLAGPGGHVVALTFFPHPRTILQPHVDILPLTTFQQREKLLSQAGVDTVEQIVPASDLLSLTPETFIQQMVRRWQPEAIIEGRDFRFGHKRQGDMNTLQQLAPTYGFDVVCVPDCNVALTDHTVHIASSSLCRRLLQQGRVRDVTCVLGRPFAIESTVIKGAQRGRELGFPTANLDAVACQLPREGVYAGTATLPDGRENVAAISVGRNPTFSDGCVRVEAHLLDYAGELNHYNWPIRLNFHSWLREQLAYECIAALVAQIGRDVDRVRAMIPPDTSTGAHARKARLHEQ
ncbi:MAG: bifunctional riboflavin kinase/FMN adenylyltransferase [Phycisphaerales bacterium]